MVTDHKILSCDTSF